MAQKVELRKRSGGSFSGNDNLMLPVTHVNYVLGLLDGNDKLNTSLLPDSMLSTKRMAGTIDADTNFGNLYTSIGLFNNSNERMYPGTYFISNGKNKISPSTDHVIYYNDDGLPAATSVELEHGDHLFYIKDGDEYLWEDTEDTATLPIAKDDAGIADLSAPYATLPGSHIFATEAELTSYAPTSSGQYVLVTGYKWVPSTASVYNAAGRKVNKTSNIPVTGDGADEREANRLAIPSHKLWNAGQQSVGLEITDAGSVKTYFKLTKVDESFTGAPKVFESIAYINKHIWGVVNNSYDLATTTSSGLMSATDKAKLNSLSNYVHPSYTSRSLDTAGVEVIDTFTSDASGHVTAISKRTLPSASTSAVGVVGLSTTAEGQAGSNASVALTPAAGLAMLNYNQDVSYFSSLTTANAATLPDGATAIVVTGTITI